MKTPMLGVLTLPFDKYLEADGISQSMLKHMARSPAHFQYALTHKEPPTENQIIGRIFHTAVLEPDQFAGSFYLRPETYPGPNGPKKWNGNSNFCKDWLDDHSNLEVITLDQHQMILDMKKSVMEHPSARRALEAGKTEYSLFVKDPETGIGLKCRPDRLSGNTIPDLKSTIDASPEGFARQVAQRGYDVQAAFYLDVANWCGLDKKYFIFIACEKEPPYAVGVYQLDEQSIECGRSKYRSWLNTAALCYETNEWPAYDPAIKTLALPDWSVRQEMNTSALMLTE